MTAEEAIKITLKEGLPSETQTQLARALKLALEFSLLTNEELKQIDDCFKEPHEGKT